MREILITNRFKKDLKKAKNNPLQNTDHWLAAIESLAVHGCLAQKYLPHSLSGNWKSKWECHIQPNFLLIYGITEITLRLERCGSHADLFESLHLLQQSCTDKATVPRDLLHLPNDAPA